MLSELHLTKPVPREDFDPAAYLAANPDVAASGIDPLRHYVCHGFMEGRAANDAASGARVAADTPRKLTRGPTLLPASLRRWWRMHRLRRSGTFDAEWYRGAYKDVAASGMDPLRHYVCHGAGEGRAPNGAALAATRDGQQAQRGRT